MYLLYFYTATSELQLTKNRFLWALVGKWILDWPHWHGCRGHMGLGEQCDPACTIVSEYKLLNLTDLLHCFYNCSLMHCVLSCSYWIDGEPNNHGEQGEDCAATYYRAGSDYGGDARHTWYDGKCNQHKYHWICEVPTRSARTSTPVVAPGGSGRGVIVC